MINDAMKSMVIELVGEAAWNSISVKAGVPYTFAKAVSYDDESTYRLVALISKELDMSATQVLSEFGKYWIKYASKSTFGPLLNLFGANLRDCLNNLNEMHKHMGGQLPNLHPPRFITREISPNKIELEYFSDRNGLPPMVNGLLFGLAEFYSEKIEVEHLTYLEELDANTPHRFLISFTN